MEMGTVTFITERRSLIYAQAVLPVSVSWGFIASVIASSISILTVGSDSMRNLFCKALIPFGKPI
jgi:hypothetical protein